MVRTYGAQTWFSQTIAHPLFFTLRIAKIEIKNLIYDPANTVGSGDARTYLIFRQTGQHFIYRRCHIPLKDEMHTISANQKNSAYIFDIHSFHIGHGTSDDEGGQVLIKY